MDIAMRTTMSASAVNWSSLSVAFVGTPIDARGHSAIEAIRGAGIQVVETSYDPETFEVTLGSTCGPADDIDALFLPFAAKRILLECTTLGIAEILLLCRAARSAAIARISLLYVEPADYAAPQSQELLRRRDFELTREFVGFRPIPEFVINLAGARAARGVFFLGYEQRRLDRALEDHQPINGNRCALVFGVPAYSPGWEMNAFSRNLRVIQESNIRPEIKFCGAASPLSAYQLLSEFERSLGTSDKMFIAPLGTKPTGIGAALFCADRKNVGIIYDHPRRKAGRTESHTKWHLYCATFS
ncbi:MAG: hypothetical protein ACT4P9_18390 [Betaproteobacteria bacterium]